MRDLFPGVRKVKMGQTTKLRYGSLTKAVRNKSKLFWQYVVGVGKLILLSPLGCFSHLLPRRNSSLCKNNFTSPSSFLACSQNPAPLQSFSCSLDRSENQSGSWSVSSWKKKQKCFFKSRYIPIQSRPRSSRTETTDKEKYEFMLATLLRTFKLKYALMWRKLTSYCSTT